MKDAQFVSNYLAIAALGIANVVFFCCDLISPSAPLERFLGTGFVLTIFRSKMKPKAENALSELGISQERNSERLQKFSLEVSIKYFPKFNSEVPKFNSEGITIQLRNSLKFHVSFIQGTEITDAPSWEEVCGEFGIEIGSEPDSEESDKDMGTEDQSEDKKEGRGTERVDGNLCTEGKLEDDVNEQTLKLTHPEDKAKFSCDECNFESKSAGKLYSHIANEHNDGKFICKYCMFETLNKTSMYNHKKKYCPEVKEKSEGLDLDKPVCAKVNGKVTYTCSYCDYVGKSEGVVYSHMADEHDMKKFQCGYCKFETGNKTSMYNHNTMYCRKVKKSQKDQFYYVK